MVIRINGRVRQSVEKVQPPSKLFPYWTIWYDTIEQEKACKFISIDEVRELTIFEPEEVDANGTISSN